MVGTQAMIGQQVNNSLVNPWQNPADAGNNAALSTLSNDQTQINSEVGALTSDYGTIEQQYAQNAAAQPAQQANINSLSSAATNYSTNSSAYPSFPNAAGAGTQTAGLQQVQQGPLGGSSAVQSADPSTAPAYGFSPWSLQGEAMTRR